MLGSAASNATMVKTRVHHARLLTADQLRQLMACPGVSEIAAILAETEPFDRVLTGSRDSLVHRGNLERLLQRVTAQEMLRLCQFDAALGSHYFAYVIRQAEVTHLIRFMRLWGAGRPEECPPPVSETLARRSRIRLDRLPECRSWDQILDALGTSPLREVMAAFRPLSGQTLDFAMLEAALCKHLFTFLWQLIERDFTGDTADELRELYGTQADLLNIRLVAREVSHFHSSQTVTQALLLPYGRAVSKAGRESLSRCTTPEELTAFLSTTRYRGRLDPSAGLLDRQCGRLLGEKARRHMCFSQHPPVTLAAYWILAQQQLEDLTTIIEGVRYQLSPEEVAGYLITDVTLKAGESHVD